MVGRFLTHLEQKPLWPIEASLSWYVSISKDAAWRSERRKAEKATAAAAVAG